MISPVKLSFINEIVLTADLCLGLIHLNQRTTLLPIRVSTTYNLFCDNDVIDFHCVDHLSSKSLDYLDFHFYSHFINGTETESAPENIIIKSLIHRFCLWNVFTYKSYSDKFIGRICSTR